MASLQLSTNLINEAGQGKWTVKSSNELSVIYEIIKKGDCSKCFIHCPECNVCIHQFHCTCSDSLVHSTICKHVHLLMRKTKVHVESHDTHLMHSHKVKGILKEVQTISSVHHNHQNKVYITIFTDSSQILIYVTMKIY